MLTHYNRLIIYIIHFMFFTYNTVYLPLCKSSEIVLDKTVETDDWFYINLDGTTQLQNTLLHSK